MNWAIIIMLILFFFVIIGASQFNKILNPVFIFNGVWFLCFLFLNLGLSSYYTNEINAIVGFFLFLIFIIFNLCFFLTYHYSLKKIKGFSINLIKHKTKKKYIIRLFLIWLVLTLMETLYCRGFPLLWTLLGYAGSYATYGIPSIHGFINSLSWFILMVSFLYYLEYKDRQILNILIMINVIYILLLARQSIITEIIQLTVIYAFKRKIQYKKLLLIGLFTVIIFGLVGNSRTELNHLIITSGMPIKNMLSFLSGFIWVYMYLMSPLANIISVMENFRNFSYGIASISNILPTAIARMFHLSAPNTSNLLVNQTYNVSSSFLTPFVDFGFFGVVLFVSFLGFYGGSLYRRLNIKSRDDSVLCNYAVYIGILALTFFSNMLLSLPIITQFIYINILFKNYFKISN
ncbi:MAG: O-antigen polymerase [Massilimicrobiota sp.]|nr:O-antigen polymerase [Massilimicrobiota sp.]